MKHDVGIFVSRGIGMAGCEGVLELAGCKPPEVPRS